jgi:hypothetical protein
MRAHLRKLAFLAALIAGPLPVVAGAQTAANAEQCQKLANAVLDHPELIEGTSQDGNYITLIGNDPSCFLEASLSADATKEMFKIVPVNLWTAIEGIANGQQQGSSLSSTGSANAVTKPSGPTSLAQEFGGLNLTSGSSSLTLTVAPGTTLADLAANGGILVCDSAIKGHTPCVSPALINALSRLTLKVSANASTASQSVSGTATSTASPNATQPVTLTSHGTTMPTFSGFTVQYAIKAPNKARAVTPTQNPATLVSTTKMNAYIQELKAANDFQTTLNLCPLYVPWRTQATKTMIERYDALKTTNSAAIELTAVIQQQYQAFANQLMSSGACPAVIARFDALFEAILAAEAYEAFGAAGANSAVPLLALEYDFNKPQNQPEYSSFKASGTLQWGRNKSNSTNAPKLKAAVDAFASSQVNAMFPTSTAGSSNCSSSQGQSGAAASAASTAAATKTSPFSITAMAGADVYNSAPPSTIPSASSLRDLQAGAEIDYRYDLHASGCGLWHNLVNGWIGSITAAGSYYYQDQTSPAILTGPPSTITFTGLPSGTTSVYSKRGVINLAQLRLGFGSGSKVTFPVAATYSNRTELIAHPTWGLQFGLSYNLSSLFSSASSK